MLVLPHFRPVCALPDIIGKNMIMKNVLEFVFCFGIGWIIGTLLAKVVFGL